MYTLLFWGQFYLDSGACQVSALRYDVVQYPGYWLLVQREE